MMLDALLASGTWSYFPYNRRCDLCPVAVAVHVVAAANTEPPFGEALRPGPVEHSVVTDGEDSPNPSMGPRTFLARIRLARPETKNWN